LSTPIRWYCATTAPLTTLPTIRTAITRPMSANAMTNGSKIAPLPSASNWALSQEALVAIAPAGRARVIVATSARICASLPAAANR
jgi:hypothetical protein